MKAPGRTVVAAGVLTAAAVVGTALIARRRGPSRAARRLLRQNWGLLSEEQRRDARTLAGSPAHAYLLKHWPPPGERDAQKKQLLATASAYVQGGSSLAEVEAHRQEVIRPPVAERRGKTLEHASGDKREDPYYWLRDDDRKDEDVLAYIKAENEYTAAVMADTEELQKQLVAEMRGRIQETDETAPIRRHGYFYYERTLEGQQYSVNCRRKVLDTSKSPAETDMASNSGPEEVMLDENKEAASHKFYMVAAATVSPDTKLLAYAVDTGGGERYDIQVRDLATGKDLLQKPIPGTSGSVVWAGDSKTLLYVTKQPKIERDFKVWRHTVGRSPDDDVAVFQEDDESYRVGIARSRDGNWLFIHTGSAITSDVRFCSAHEPEGQFRHVLPRQHDVEYDVEPRGDHFFIEIRDAKRPNKEIQVAPIATPTRTQVFVPHREEVAIDGFDLSRDYFALHARQNALQTATVYRLPANEAMPEGQGQGEALNFEESAYELSGARQGDFDSPAWRLRYSSLTTPSTVLEHDMSTGKRKVVKETPVLGGFDKGNYVTERRWCKASDGTEIPFTLLWRKGLAKLDGSDPFLLYGYGSYQITIDPGFRRDLLSLIDRGFMFAIAHIRGGGELGRQWYENGKYLHKKNTFNDFIAVAEHLIAEGLAKPERLCMEGRSAGGLLMGAVLNMAPHLFKACLAGVPFVDVVTTMLDESIPLTTGEWEEWGNPASPENDFQYYKYMLSYSPIDNVKTQRYPDIFVSSGLHDPRVAYWEPAKWVAKLRTLKQGDSVLLHKTNMGAGHFSESGRFDRLKDKAEEYAFLLKAVGALPAPKKADS